MKLIDLLLQELPKRGGWPERVAAFIQEDDGDVHGCESKDLEYIDGQWISLSKSNWTLTGGQRIIFSYPADDHATAVVTREQYESVLQQPVWNGEGLPPVGCRIEAFSGGEWVEAIVTYNERPECHGDAAAWKEVLAYDCKTTRPFWTDEFRPIRSEADKKRDEVGLALYHAINWNAEGELVSPSRMEDYKKAYDAIAAGKIHGIKLSD